MLKSLKGLNLAVLLRFQIAYASFFTGIKRNGKVGDFFLVSCDLQFPY